MTENFQIKNYLNAELVTEMATNIQKVAPDFNAAAFVTQVNTRLESLELKERAAWIAECLREYLPSEYPEAIKILLTLLTEASEHYVDGMFERHWFIMPIAYFVEVYGLDEQHYDVSMNAMREITMRSSSEFAIRPYLQKYPEKTLAILETWAEDNNEHVRRLVSESTRTRLPWASRLPQFIDDPTSVIRLLEKLKDDSALYVRRSVANNLNDLTKDHPEMVVDLLSAWHKNADKNRQWLIKHALRSLIKQGHPATLALLGFGAADVTLSAISVTPQTIHMGETLHIELTLQSNDAADRELLVDYIMHFMKKNGSTAPKVFKLTTCTLAPGETITLTKNFPIKPLTTRKYYPGQQRVEVQVNGSVVGGTNFTLILEDA